jgi:hypothetical protein
LFLSIKEKTFENFRPENLGFEIASIIFNCNFAAILNFLRNDILSLLENASIFRFYFFFFLFSRLFEKLNHNFAYRISTR